MFFLVVVHAALGLLDEGFELDAAGAAGGTAHGDRIAVGLYIGHELAHPFPHRAGRLVHHKGYEFIAADASADTAFADGILQKLSDKADGEVPFFMPVQVVDDL